MTEMMIEDGLVAIVKRDCPTCELISPVLLELGHTGQLVVYTQDDPTFPETADWVRDDHDLGVSYHREIETVPTLLRFEDGVEVERTVGWSRDDWQTMSGVDELGADLPEMRPGCGSLSVDPTRVDELRVRFGGSVMRARRVELAALEDEFEALFDRGWTDGLPVVPPTEARVLRMLDGTIRDADEVVAVVPPNLVECSVEKVAISAVMAGCRPEYLPVVLAALEAICTDEFNMHGVLATTMSVGPIFVVNGPIRHELGMNSGINALGHGNRANSTIGRAVQLVVRNFGGGAPGGIDRATLGHPGKIGLCFAEDEEGSAWEPLATSLGAPAGINAVTAFCSEGPHIVVDQKSRSPESLTRLLAQALRTAVSPRMVMGVDAMLVMSPEHMTRYRDAGWDRARFFAELGPLLEVDGAELVEGVDGIDEGLPAAFGSARLPKFREGGLLVVQAGGPAGLFSAIMGGWVNGKVGSDPVVREIRA